MLTSKGPRMLVNNAWPDVASENKAAGYRLPPDLIRLVQKEAMEEGLVAGVGRAYNPSTVVERILRAYFDAKSRGDEEAI